MVPNRGWRHGILGDAISDIRAGVSVNSEDRPIRDGEIGVLKITSVFTGVFDPARHKAVLTSERHRVGEAVRAGRVLVSRANGNADLVGMCAYVDREHPNLYLPDKLWSITAKPDVNTKWLYYVCSSASLKERIKQSSSGSSTLRNITQSSFLSLPIAIPLRDEQDAIADLLETWDEAILLNRKLRIRVAEMLDSLLGLKLRAAHSNLPILPSGWTPRRLGDVGMIVSGGTPATANPSFWKGDIWWTTPAEITQLPTRYVNQSARSISAAGLQASSAEVLPVRSLIVCTRATVGDMAINTVPMATNQGFKSIIPKQDVNVEFLYFYLRANVEDLRRLGAGSTFSEVSKAAFEKMPVALPPLDEQNRLADLFGAMADEIALLDKIIEQISLQKSALQTGLISGELRLVSSQSDFRVAVGGLNG